MTEAAASLDLEAAEQGIKDLYTVPEKRVLDPEAMEGSLLERMPNPTGWRMLILPYRGKEMTRGSDFK